MKNYFKNFEKILIGTVGIIAFTGGLYAENIAKPNPYLSAPIYGITHFDSAQSDSYPYPVAKGVYNFNLNNYFWTINYLNYWNINFRTTFKRIRPNGNEFITNWRVFFYYCNAWCIVTCYEWFLVSNCGCSFSSYSFYNSIHDKILSTICWFSWEKITKKMG